MKPRIAYWVAYFVFLAIGSFAVTNDPYNFRSLLYYFSSIGCFLTGYIKGLNEREPQ